MFKTEITVLNTACIEALRVLQHEYSERVKHGAGAKRQPKRVLKLFANSSTP
jgi:hypothetical protein